MGKLLEDVENLLEEINSFVRKNIIDIKVTEGPLLKEARKVLAEGLRNLAKVVENPDSNIKLLDIRKKKTPRGQNE